MNRPRHAGPRSRPAAVIAAVVAALGAVAVLWVAVQGDGGREDARRGRKQLERAPDPAVAERELLAAVNRLRTDKGLRPLQVHPDLADKARSWSATMAGEQRLYHSPLSDGVTAEWAKLAENVGQGGAAESIHQSFVASPRHHTNLTDPVFTHIGVGASRTSDGTLFVTQVFMEAGQAPAPPAPPQGVPRPSPTRPPVTRRLPAAVPPGGVTAPPPGSRSSADFTSAAVRQPTPRLLHVLRQLKELEG